MATTTERPTVEQIWAWLGDVPDPEIPMVSVVDLGIVREIEWREGEGGAHCLVTITPTYSGCPATEVIAQSIEEALRTRGVTVRLQNRISPAWTTDWISEAGRTKLRASGIAPPPARAAGDVAVIDISGLKRKGQRGPAVVCPHCGSENTSVTSQFGSTACKALYRCNDCLDPFDYFKPH
jgi:ring-1,2-phenylacetyl-CoA epoxidase subunit PaaD